MNRFYLTMEDEPVTHLINSDSQLFRLITSVGTLDVPIDQDFYRSLVKRIIGQQLSLKAAHTIVSRVENIWENLNPELFKDIPADLIRGCGVSLPKLRYIQDLTQKHLSGEVDLSNIHLLNNNEVIETLTNIKGIGKWTAEMFLIFSLGRINVLSYGDVSINNAIRWLYQIDKEKQLDLDYFYDKWKPYNSIASLYLWKAIDLGFVKKHPNKLNK